MSHGYLSLLLTLLILAATPLHAAGPLEVTDGALRIVFDEKGRLQSLSGFDGELSLVDGEMNLIPFALVYRSEDGDEIVTVPDDKIEYGGFARGKEGHTLMYLAPDLDVAVNLTLSFVAPGVSRWRFVIENRGETRVWRLDGPRLGRLVIGEGPDDDVLIYPRKSVMKIDSNFKRKRAYDHLYGKPLSMGWTDLYQPGAGGVFLMDANVERRLFGLWVDAESSGRKWWDIGERRYVHAPKGEKATHVAHIGVHKGDWHAAADHYRAWFYRHFEHAEHPDWFVDAVGWHRRPLSQTDDQPMATWDNHLREAFDRGRFYGSHYVGVWGNNVDNVPCGLFHYPNIRMGGPGSIVKATRELLRQGAHFAFYINCYRHSYEYKTKPYIGYTLKSALPEDLPRDPFRDPEWFLERCLYNLDGSIHGPRTGGGCDYWPYQKQCRLDYTSKGWQNYMLDTVRRHLDWGVGLYLDEAGVSSTVNYKPVVDPQVRGPGTFMIGLHTFLKNAIAEARKIDPGYVLAGEAINEMNGIYIGAQTDQGYGQFTEAYLYTHPSHRLLRTARTGPRQSPWLPKMRRAFVRGELITLQGIGMREIALLAQAVVDLERFERGARFRDDIGIEVVGEGPRGKLDLHNSAKPTELVTAKRWDTTTVGRAVTAVNVLNYHAVEDVTLRIDMRDVGKPTRAVFYSVEKLIETLPFEIRDDGRVEVTLPAVRLGAVVLVAEETDEKSLRVSAQYSRRAAPRFGPAADATGRHLVEAAFANLGEAAMELTIDIETDAELTFEGRRSLELAPGEVRRAMWWVEGMDELRRLAEAQFVTRAALRRGEARAEGPVDRQTLYIMPPLPVSSMEADTNADSVPDCWWGPLRIDPDHAAAGRASGKLAWEHRIPMTGRVDPANPEAEAVVMPPAGEGELKATAQMYLKPGSRYRLRAQFRAEKAGGRFVVRVVTAGDIGNGLHNENVGRGPVAGSSVVEVSPVPWQYDGAWHPLELTFETPEDMEIARLELIQTGSPEPVWVDDVRVVKVRDEK